MNDAAYGIRHKWISTAEIFGRKHHEHLRSFPLISQLCLECEPQPLHRHRNMALKDNNTTELNEVDKLASPCEGRNVASVEGGCGVLRRLRAEQSTRQSISIQKSTSARRKTYICVRTRGDGCGMFTRSYTTRQRCRSNGRSRRARGRARSRPQMAPARRCQRTRPCLRASCCVAGARKRKA